MKEWTPYITLAIVTVLGFIGYIIKELMYQPLKDLIKEHSELKEDVVILETSFKYYLDTLGKGAAMQLKTPNPTPPDVQNLLDKYVAGQLTDEDERDRLRGWLDSVLKDPQTNRDRYGTALQLRATMGARKRLSRSAAR